MLDINYNKGLYEWERYDAMKEKQITRLINMYDACAYFKISLMDILKFKQIQINLENFIRC